MADSQSAVRAQVRTRARGMCEYCRLPEQLTLVAHEVDHIIAAKHGGSGDLSNLALCCALCNRHKGTDLASVDPVTGRVEQLFHPRTDRWTDHFVLDGPRIVGSTPAGRVTAKLLQFNRVERLRERALVLQAGWPVFDS